MSRERTIKIAAINIEASPHPKGTYFKLFDEAKGKAAKIKGNDYAELLFMRKTKLNGHRVIIGEIGRYVKIDEKSDWFNTETGKPATKKDLKNVSIPDPLRPNLKMLSFIFVEDIHVMFFVRQDRSASLSPGLAEAWMERLLKACPSAKKLGSLKINSVKDDGYIKQIFSKKRRVARLEITIDRPNADGGEDARSRLMASMKKERTKRKTDIYVSMDNRSIRKTDGIADRLEVSELSGKAKAITYDKTGKREEFDSTRHPMARSYRLSEEQNGLFPDFLKREIKRLAEKIRKNTKND